MVLDRAKTFIGLDRTHDSHCIALQEVKECIDKAQKLEHLLKSKGEKCARNEFANTLVFDRPNDAIVRKYHLACEKKLSHVVIMPHASMTTIEQFAIDLVASRSIEE